MKSWIDVYEFAVVDGRNAKIWEFALREGLSTCVCRNVDSMREGKVKILEFPKQRQAGMGQDF